MKPITCGRLAGASETARGRQALAGALRQDKEVIELPAADLVGKSADAIGEGRHPERGTVFGMRRSITNDRSRRAAALSAAFGIGVVHAGAAFIAIEALKKSDTFDSDFDARTEH